MKADVPLPAAARTAVATRAWRVLTSMPFAVAMLFIVAVASVAGSLIEQNQPYAVYVSNYGTLWADFYRLSGVDDVYHAAWFLLLLAALAVSTGLCVWQKTPSMWRELRSYKEGFSYQQATRVADCAEVRLTGDPAAAATRIRSVLLAHGFRLHAGEGDGSLAPGHITGKKGAARRIGYLLTHGAIVVICVGGLADGNLGLKWRLATGAVAAETRAVAPDGAAASARLGVDAGSFRGALRLKQAEASDQVVLNVEDGFLTRELPFRVRLQQFRIDYHPTGQPRDFVSTVDLLDKHDGSLLRSLRLSVNHPAAYEGIEFFQSGFDDGGTRLAVQLLGGTGSASGVEDITVGERRPVLIAGAPAELQATQFHLKNLVAEAQSGGSLARAFLGGARKGQQTDLGPSVEISIKDAAGQARTQTSYVDPLRVEGRAFFVVGVADPSGGNWKYLRLPLDASGSLASYQRVIEGLRAAAANNLPPSLRVGGADPAAAALVRRAAPRIAADFLSAGFRALSDGAVAAGAHAPAAEPERELKIELLVRTALMAYLQDRRTMPPGDALRFVADSLLAYSDWTQLDRPTLVKVISAVPAAATVLQVSQAPGRWAVYAGMACLALGVSLLVMVKERRVWVRPVPATDRYAIALAGPSPHPSVAGELEQIVTELAPHARPPTSRGFS